MTTTSTPSDGLPADGPLPDSTPPGSEVGPELGPAAVLLLGFSSSEARVLEKTEAIDADVFVAQSLAEAHTLLGEHEMAVVGLGPDMVGPSAHQALNEILERHPKHEGCNIVLATGPDLEMFQDMVSEDRLYYLTQKPPPRSDIVHILQSGIEHYRSRSRSAVEHDDDFAIATHRVLRLTENLARESTLDHAVLGTVEAVTELVEADRASVLLYDPTSETLWNRKPGSREERRESAAAGLVSFVVRTRASINLDHIGADPRYDPEADNDQGSPEERFLAVSVTDPAAGGRVWAVLVALRSADKAPFSESDQDQLRLLAEQIAPVFGRFLLQAELEERTVRRHGVWGSETSQLFREEALEHYVRGMEDRGNVLRIAPGWTTWAYRLLVLIFVTAVFLSLVLPIDEYAPGTAVVRLEGHSDVTATLAGSVVSIDVIPGQKVAKGDLLVRLYGVQEEAEYERSNQEFETGLVHRLRNPSDPNASQALSTLRLQRNLASKRLEQRSIRAPRSGTVGDVWIRPGQHLTPGQVILSLSGGRQELSIIALVPGHFRPLIQPGMDLRFEINGYSYAYQHLQVESVGDEIVGPNEASRFLGPGIGDAFQVNGPVVYVTARLPKATFDVDGHTYAYHDGILGTAEIKVRSEKILVALIPGFKAVRNRFNASSTGNGG